MEVTEELVSRTMGAIEGIRALERSNTIPPPMLDSPKCMGCSLSGICLPDETNQLEGKDKGCRRLYPSRDDSIPVYVVGDGALVKKREGRLEVWRYGEKVNDIPLHDVSQVSLYGNASMTQPIMVELMQRDVPILFFSSGGWFMGHTMSTWSKKL